MAITDVNNILFINTDMGSSFQSESIRLDRRIGFAIDVQCTGSPNGAFYLAASVDDVNFTVVDDSSEAITGAGNILYNVKDAMYSYVKLCYTRSSGSGSATAKFSTKEAN